MKRKDFSNLKIESSKNKAHFFSHENYIAGAPPYLRGIYTTMYLQNQFITPILVNETLPISCNHLLKTYILAGKTNFHLNFNTTNNQNGEIGICVKNIADFKILFQTIDLSKLHITLSSNGDILPILDLFLTAINDLNIKLELLNISIEINVLETTNHHSTIDSVTIFESILNYSNKNLLPINKLIFSNSNKSQTKETKLATSLHLINKCIKNSISNGLKIDVVASKIALNMAIDEICFEEIAFMRAARMLWANMLKPLNPQNTETMALELHCKIPIQKQSTNFDIQQATTSMLTSMVAIFGGSQTLQITNNSEFSQFIVPYLFEEIEISKTVDPLAGSTIIEKHTETIFNRTWKQLIALG
jgi:methylmalonyl-CoA mutase